MTFAGADARVRGGDGSRSLTAMIDLGKVPPERPHSTAAHWRCRPIASELLALAWLAAHEGRAADSAQFLAWFATAQRGGGNYGPHTFTHCSR